MSKRPLPFREVFLTVVTITGAAGLYLGLASFLFPDPMTTAQNNAIEVATITVQLGFGTILGLLGSRVLD